MAKSAILHSRINEGSYRVTILWSALFHALLFTILIFFPDLIPAGKPFLLGTGPGGGSGGDTIPITLADDQSGGIGQYKPSFKPQLPAVEPPKPEPNPKDEKATELPALTKEKKEKKEPKPPKDLAKVPSNYIPVDPGPGAGGAGHGPDDLLGQQGKRHPVRGHGAGWGHPGRGAGPGWFGQ